MKTQMDTRMRVVTLQNLKAMCDHQSGVCHRYWVERVTRLYVTVGYSNPDEYGSEDPVYALFPCFPNTYWPGNEDNPMVVVDYIQKLINAGQYDDYFEYLQDCPVLWLSPDDNQWHLEGRID